MKWFSCVAKILMVFALFYLIFPKQAYAYLDPGTGSYIFQLIMAGLFGVALVIKIFWRRIKAFLSAQFHKKQKEENEGN